METNKRYYKVFDKFCEVYKDYPDTSFYKRIYDTKQYIYMTLRSKSKFKLLTDKSILEKCKIIENLCMESIESTTNFKDKMIDIINKNEYSDSISTTDVACFICTVGYTLGSYSEVI